MGEHSGAQLVAALQQIEGRIVRPDPGQIDIEGQEVGLPPLEVDQVLMKVDAVEIGHIAVAGLHIGPQIIDGIAGDPGLQPARHGAVRDATDQFAIEDAIALAQDRRQPGDDLRRLFDKGQPVREPVQQVAPRARIDPAILGIGVERRLLQKQG